MYLNLLAEGGSTSVIEGILVVLLAIVGIAIGVMTIVASFLRWSIIHKYRKYNRQDNKAGLTGEQSARLLLDNLGMQDVKVEKVGFLNMLLFGNSYSKRKKTIRLRRNIINTTSITAVGLATQKVGLAIQDKNNDKKFKTLYALRLYSFFAPVMFIPIVIVGAIADALFMKTGGVVTTVALILSFLFLVFSFIVTMLTIPVEKKACTLALEMMEKTDFLDEEEREKIADVYRTYIKAYVVDFIISILEIIKFILRVLLAIVRSKADN